MKTAKSLVHRLNFFAFATFLAVLLAGCCETTQKSTNPSTGPAMAAAPAAAAPVVAVDTKPALPTIRIKTGVTDGFTDNSGNAWLPDQGFTDGETVERPDIAIANTTDQRIYRAERYSMTHFTQALPNGHYNVKLHFCETYDGITGPGQRRFPSMFRGMITRTLMCGQRLVVRCALMWKPCPWTLPTVNWILPSRRMSRTRRSMALKSFPPAEA